MKKIIIPIMLIILVSLAIFVSAKETMVGGGFECDTLVENAGSVRLIDFSYPNVEVEVTTNSYVGSSFLGFFHPMKLMTENLAAEIKIETQTYTPPIPHGSDQIIEQETIEQKVYVYGPDHLNLILGKYYNYGGYPRKERVSFQVGPYDYKINFLLRAKTFANLFTAKCNQANLGVIELKYSVDRDSGDQENGDYGYDSSEDSGDSGLGDIPSPPALPSN